MKNLKNPSGLLNILLIAVLTFLLYTNCAKPKEETQQHTEYEIDIEKLNSQLIPNKEVFKLYKGYNAKDSVVSQYMREVTGKKDFNDTRTVLFDFKVLYDYLEHVKKESETRGTIPEGIKITFGSYNSNGEFPNKTSVFLTPTKKDNNVQSAYTISNGKIVFFKNLKKKLQETNVQKGSFLMLNLIQDEEEGLALNRAGLIPPPNNGDSDFQ